MAKRFWNWWLRVAYRVLLRLRVEGRENIPAAGPVILMINHISFMDPFVVVGSVPRPATAMSKLENFRIPFWGLVFKLYGAIPVRRGEVDRSALKQAFSVLETDTMLLIAPEGTRSPNAALQPTQQGLAYIAYRSDAAVVPVAITGSEQFKQHITRLRRTPVHVRIGQPFRFRRTDHRPRRDILSEMADEAIYQLAALLPPDYRGTYSDLDHATQNYIQFIGAQEGSLTPARRNVASSS
jgi:1-acyl-sn-glycerol-3-phosphate acyltransferase